jgi:hypothetical protein
LATTSREATKTHFLIDTFTMTQTAETPGIQDFSKAKIAGGGAIEGMESEVELKRLVSATLGGEDVFLTLTNKRLLVRAAKGGSPRQIMLDQIVKAKTPSAGFFSSKKPTTKMTLKTTEGVKYAVEFKEAFLSIVPATQERDDFCQLIMDHVKNTDDGAVVSP